MELSDTSHSPVSIPADNNTISPLEDKMIPSEIDSRSVEPTNEPRKTDENEQSLPQLSFDPFWSTLGFHEINMILSVLIHACDQATQGELKSKLKDALYFVAGVRTNLYGYASRYRHMRVLFHDTSLENVNINVACENLEDNKYDELIIPNTSNDSGLSDYLKEVNSDIPEKTSHLLQLFIFNSNEADSVFLHGRMEYFLRFERIKRAVPIFLTNIDYNNAYMLALCRREFPSFTEAFSDFLDLNQTRILSDVQYTGSSITYSMQSPESMDLQRSNQGLARLVRFKASLVSDALLKIKYRWIKRFLDWIDLFSVDIYDDFDFDQDKLKPKRQAASLKWLKKDVALYCDFLKAKDKILFSFQDERPLEEHLRNYLENPQAALENAISWKEGDAFVFKVSLRLCLSTYLSVLNGSTRYVVDLCSYCFRFTFMFTCLSLSFCVFSNALYFRLTVVHENKVHVTFVGVDGYAAGFFFPTTLRELKRSFLFVGTIDECTVSPEDIVGEYSRLSVCAFGRSLSLGIGRFIAGIIVFLWTQFALSEAVFEVISVLKSLMSALLNDIHKAGERCRVKGLEESPLPGSSYIVDNSLGVEK